jgi:hypothetical protein
MKKILLATVFLAAVTACLKHDVLRQDASGNFRESEFYRSGNFQNSFGITFSDTSIVTVRLPNGEFRCKPIFTIQLSDAYRTKLEQEWDGNYEIRVSRPIVLTEPESFKSDNLKETFRIQSMPSVVCGTPVNFNVQLLLITPSTSVIATAQKDFSMPTNP